MPSRVWLITGTSSGFGRRLVASVLARGDCVIASARSIDKIQDLPPSSNLRTLQLDVTDDVDIIKSRIDQAAAMWGSIDVLVNNAGTGYPGLLEEGGEDRLMLQYKLNVFGLLNVTNMTLPHMRKNKSGTVIFMGSRSAWKAEKRGLGPYASSKAAVRAMAETFSVELAPFNIRVLLVEPGAFRTEQIYINNFYVDNPITDYEDLRLDGVKNWDAIAGKQPGDPNKAMEIVVDVVRGEGVAAGRPWPLYLVLGEDAEQDIRNKCQKMLNHLDQWKDVVRGTKL